MKFLLRHVSDYNNETQQEIEINSIEDLRIVQEKERNEHPDHWNRSLIVDFFDIDDSEWISKEYHANVNKLPIIEVYDDYKE